MLHNQETINLKETSWATWVGFGMMCVGMFMAILDIQVVATSITTIQSELNIAPDKMSWIQTAYLIAEVIAIPLTGFLTRLLGMRWLFVSAVVIFTAASLGCASSQSFDALVIWRIVQGFSGGTLIPAVFSAVFILFPKSKQGIATTLAGVLAVLAPTIGPIVGGWITSTYSWNWLFLINILPGIFSAFFAGVFLPHRNIELSVMRKLDIISLILLTIALGSLEIALKDAPQRGWLSGYIISLLVLSGFTAFGFIAKTLKHSDPLVDLTNFASRSFSVGCILSFVLGVGLYGSVYLMPIFLAFVREHNALEIGTIMLVTGLSQLLIAPIAVVLEQKMDARLLTAIGFGLLASGLGMSAFQTPNTDFNEMMWPQIIRGLATMFCLLPPTRLALGELKDTNIPDASGLFNLMRNLGGAIGIALIDTIIYSRTPFHDVELVAGLSTGNLDIAKFIGIPPDLASSLQINGIDATSKAMLQPLIEKAALVQAINEAWAMIAILTIFAFFCIPFAKKREVSFEKA